MYVCVCMKAIKQGELTVYIREYRAERLNNSTNVCEV